MQIFSDCLSPVVILSGAKSFRLITASAVVPASSSAVELRTGEEVLESE